MINKEIDIDAVVRSNQSEILRVIGRYLSCNASNLGCYNSQKYYKK